jgi:hypothetical protein
MGCGASAQPSQVESEAEPALQYNADNGPMETVTAKDLERTEVPESMKQEMVEDALDHMMEAERAKVDYKPVPESFLGSVLAAREKCKDDAAVMTDACERLRARSRPP